MRYDRQGRGPCFFVLAAVIPALCIFLGPEAPSVEAAAVWTEVPSPTPNALYSVEYLNRIEAWAVGADGAVVRYMNGFWRNSPSGSDEGLFDLALLGRDEAWAVGDNGTILHYADTTGAGAKWDPDPQSKALTLIPLHAVTFINRDNGWAVGGSDAQGGVVLHYNGSTWLSATTTRDPLYGLFAIASDNIWFCGGNRRLMHFDGTGFSGEPSPVMDGQAWRAVNFPFLSVGWAVGDGGTIARYSKATPAGWSTHAQGSAICAETLNAISILSQDGRGYVVGSNGVRLHFNGAVFELEALGGEDLRDVAIVNEHEGGAVGGVSRGRIAHLRMRTYETGLDNVRVYPNPFDPSRDLRMTFDRLPGDVSALEVFTVLGERVADLSRGIGYEPVTGMAVWTGLIPGGRPAATGSYIYRIRTRSGAERGGVFLVVKR